MRIAVGRSLVSSAQAILLRLGQAHQVLIGRDTHICVEPHSELRRVFIVFTLASKQYPFKLLSAQGLGMQNEESKASLVFDKNGLHGKIVDYTTAANSVKCAVIVLNGGVQVTVPVQILTPRKTAGYDIAGTFEEWRKQTNRTAPDNVVEKVDTITIPVIEEDLEVQNHRVETSVLRINKTISEREEVVEHAVTKESVKIERIPINRVVKKAANSRYENNTWIIPVYEEVIVSEKRLVLLEEIRITKEISVEQHRERIPLRKEDVTVEKSNGN